MFFSYQEVVLLAVSAMGLTLLLNLLSIRQIPRSVIGGDAPMVSVLLPVRNEERTIGLVLSSLADQEYPNYEVLILDDHSDDATVSCARPLIEANPRFRLLQGKELPDGWVGKNFACHQLSQEAKGDLLLFIDADTVHTRQSVSSAVAELERTGAGLLTLIPDERMETFWEKTFLPLLHFTLFALLPAFLFSRSRPAKLAMANGQYLLFRREDYERIGGHQAVRRAMVEDVWLSRLIKAHGARLAIGDGGMFVSCRMYRSLGEIWNGFSKNLFAGFQYSIPAMALAMIFNFCSSVFPFAALLWGVFAGDVQSSWFLLVAAQVAILLGIRVVLAVRFHLSVWSAFLHPLAVLVLIGIAVNSCRWVFSRRGVRWKGREYDLRRLGMIS
jgi:chlorobactene glucosyltransferase